MIINRICIKDYEDDDFIYIGRPSNYGNPYSSKVKNIAEYTVDSKKEAISLYREYLIENINIIDDLISEMKSENVNKIGCFCSTNSSCHGDILIDLVNERRTKSIF